jgi:DNA-directed RNA polymerase subunit beta'
MLQEAVDALFDNGRRGRVLRGTNNRPLKSLSDTLKGKQGPVPPEPARQARRLLRPLRHRRRPRAEAPPVRAAQEDGARALQAFIYNKLEERQYVSTIKAAKEMVELERPEVWDILEEVIQEHPGPPEPRADAPPPGDPGRSSRSRRRQGDQDPPLVVRPASTPTSTAIRWRCTLPLSPKAQVEARYSMLSTQNIFIPVERGADRRHSQDIVLGVYYLDEGEE